MSIRYLDKKSLGAALDPLLERADFLVSLLEKKSEKKYELSFTNEWVIKKARSTRGTCYVEFGHNLDLPLVWPLYMEEYAKLKDLVDKLTLEARKLKLDVEAEFEAKKKADAKREEERKERVAAAAAAGAGDKPKEGV